MRARGADITDIVVLVVAANDGVMPQTIEAIQHAKKAGKTVIVAINKCDLPAANPDRVKAQLAEHGLQTHDYGGETEFAEVSAITGQGMTELLELMALQAEVLELRANPKGKAHANIIEARVVPGRGTSKWARLSSAAPTPARSAPSSTTAAKTSKRPHPVHRWRSSASRNSPMSATIWPK
jgi:translation initiation factor IF-2